LRPGCKPGPGPPEAGSRCTTCAFYLYRIYIKKSRAGAGSWHGKRLLPGRQHAPGPSEAGSCGTTYAQIPPGCTPAPRLQWGSVVVWSSTAAPTAGLLIGHRAPVTTNNRRAHRGPRHTTSHPDAHVPHLRTIFFCCLCVGQWWGPNPHRPIFNPYTQRSLYKNTRYLRHKQNRTYKDKQHKFTYVQQHEGLQNPKPKKHKRSVETEKQKGKRPASDNENLAQFSTPTKRSRIGPKSHSAEGHRKGSKSKKRSHTATDNR
jgi:hypothetical protein